MILEGKTIVYKEYKNVEPTKEEKEIIKNYGIFFLQYSTKCNKKYRYYH